MATIHEVINNLVIKYGGVNKEIALKLSRKANKPISPQRLGQYRAGPKVPSADFLLLWYEVYGDNILELVKGGETIVSRGNPKKPPANEDREAILIKTIDRIGETNEYLLKRVKDLERGG